MLLLNFGNIMFFSSSSKTPILYDIKQGKSDKNGHFSGKLWLNNSKSVESSC